MNRPALFFRRALLLALAMSLLCSCAQAAPARDIRKLDVRPSESLRSLISLFGAASLLRDVRELPENSTSEPLMEGVLVLGLSRGLLAGTDGDPSKGVQSLPVSSALELLEGLLGKEHTRSDFRNPTCPCLKLNGDTLTADYRGIEEETAGGARIFSVTEEGNRLVVLADVYASLASWQTNPQEVSEDCLTWEYTARFVLEQADGRTRGKMPFGYRLVSMDSFPEWEEGCLDNWRSVRQDRFSFAIPGFLSSWDTVESPDTGLVSYTFEAPDGRRGLTVLEEGSTGSDPLGRFRADYLAAHPDAQVSMEPLLRYATAETEGEYAIVFAPKNSGEVFTFTLRFPPERQYEYSFIGEMIRNSFWCAGVPMG